MLFRSRLLFISAHLAAHASGLEIRKANVRKILEEMEIDDFTGLPARHGGDVSDRFDQAFFLGDLKCVVSPESLIQLCS